MVEVVTRGEGRRNWSSHQKRRIVVEAMQPGVTPTEVVRRWGLTSSLFYMWRRQVMSGELGAVPAPLPAFAQVADDAPVPIMTPTFGSSTRSGTAAACPGMSRTASRAH
ncbi:transposase [Falsiroseomonas sp. HW251]|uniref:transposase n=1 Tax=Falsiroseomonas sp. HW251 TaxID=3390998 RepID=UPI003D310350